MTLGMEHVDEVRLNVVPRGALHPDAAEQQLSARQVAAVEEADEAVADWLEQSPDRAAALLADPAAALREALPEGPPAPLVDLLDPPREEAAEEVEAIVADAAAAFAPVAPASEPQAALLRSRTKPPRAGRDVTYMLGLGPLADAFHAVRGERLRNQFAGTVPLVLPDVNLPGGVRLEAIPITTRPDIELAGRRARAGLVFRVQLHVGSETLAFGDLVMLIGLRPTSTPPDPGLSLGVLPDPGDVTVGSLAGGADPSDIRVAAVDVDDLDDPLKELDDLLDQVDDEDVDVPAEIEELLTSATPAEIRAAVADVLTTAVLPLLRLEADVPHGALVCDLAPGAVQAGFLPADDPGQDALAIGLNFAPVGDAAPVVDLPSESVVPHGRDGWIEVSNNLLLRIACCLMPATFTGLSPQPATRTSSACRWQDEVVHDAEGTRWDLHHLEVAVAEGLELDAELSRSWPGVRATASINLRLQLAEDGGGLDVTHLKVDVSVDLEWWARITIVAVAAAIGLICGGLWWAAGGAAIGVGLVLLIEAALDLFGPDDKPDVLDDLEQPLRLLPPQVTDVFGTPTPERVVWDDLEAVTRIVPPGEVPQVVVPDVVGTDRAEAQQVLLSAGLQGVVRQVFSDEDHGTVVAQRPATGTERDEGGSVRIKVSRGPSPIEENPREVPDVVGLREEAARAALVQAGFELRAGGFAHSDRPPGEVIGQRPAAGTSVLPGAEVRLTVSRGPAPGGGTGGGGGGRLPGTGGSGKGGDVPVVRP